MTNLNQSKTLLNKVMTNKFISMTNKTVFMTILSKVMTKIINLRTIRTKV